MKLLLECLIVLIPEWLARSNHSSNQTIRQSCNLLNFHFSICLTDGSAELVGARCVFPAAADAFQSGQDILDFHALDKASNALQVAVAAAEEDDVVKSSVDDVEVYLLAAGLFSLIGVVHGVYSFYKIIQSKK